MTLECHNLATIRGNTAMVSTKGMVPWHGLGTVVEDEALTSADAIKLAHMDWEVYKNTLKTIDADGQEIEVPNKYAIVRGDAPVVLGIVGKQYKTFANSKAFEFFDDIVGQKLAVYETAGVLDNGRVIWIMAKLPKELRIQGSDDITKCYTLLSTSHDGTMSLQVMPTTVRVVCQNTLRLAISSANSLVKVRHVQNMDNKLEMAQSKLKVVHSILDNYHDQMNEMARIKFDGQKFSQFVQKLVPDNPNAKNNTRTENIRELITKNFENHEFAQTRGTAWAAFNAFTQYVDHDRTVRSSDETKKAEARMDSLLFGSGASVKDKALKLALSN